ncbi:MAG: response regulator [Gemmataceae bacterium]|nr:response regulator [Gemmataceae bacterium]
MNEQLRLFVVEDDDDFAYLIRKSLERAGHHVTVCRTAADALIVLSNTQFHLVLLDQKLPDLAGLDLLRTLNREGITTPVLMVTGYGDEHLATQVLRAGALDYIVKDRALTFLTDLPKRVHESVMRHRLQQTNRLLIEALESARDGIMITDLQGTILHVNAALEQMMDYGRQDMLGQQPRLFKSDVHGKEFFQEFWNTILSRTSWQGEIVNRRQDGTLIDTSLTVSPILDPTGQLTHFVGIYRDMTERKHIERQLFQAQKMQSVGTLAGGVAHEFNNLLAGIQGYASLGLREKDTKEAVRRFLELIVQLSERAANLTRQLLAFARKPALSRQPTSMASLLTSTADLVRHSLNIEVTVAIDPADEGLVALADANQLQQVLVNLSLNARDAAGPGAAKPLEFRLRHCRLTGDLAAFPQNVPAGDYVVFEVKDYGVGMPADVLAQALDPFFTTKDVGQGTGLGLPVAFGIVHGHQGQLTLQSDVGHGTCASIFLPRQAEPTAVSAPVAPQVLEPEATPRRHILIIDDEEAVRDVVRRFLEIAGHHVACVTSGAEGIETLRGEPKPDLVILDLMIPREDGAANFRTIHAAHPHIPILLCTGLVQTDLAQALLEEGAVELLRKPFRMSELWYAVNKAVTA